MKIILRLLASALLLSSVSLSAQSLEALRGGWVADIDDSRHVLYIVLRNDKVSGTHCFDCYNPDNLAFIDDGTLDENGLHFSLYHYSDSTDQTIETVDARLQGNELHLTIKRSGTEPVNRIMHREQAQEVPPAPVNPRSNQPGGGRPRTLPGAAETITADKVLGMWLWGTGPGKQVFFFKRHKGGIRGMVCGPCNSARAFAPLENISMNGTNFHFDIVHEDNGRGFEEHGPFDNVTDAEISMNELHMTTYSSFDPQGRTIEMTLLGPIHYMPADN